MTNHTVVTAPATFCRSVEAFFTNVFLRAFAFSWQWLHHIKVLEPGPDSSESVRRITRFNNLIENPGGQYWGHLRGVNGLDGAVAQNEIALQVSD